MKPAVTSQCFFWTYLGLISFIFVLGYQSASFFAMSCAICAALFWLTQLWLTLLLEKQENRQRKFGKPIGFFLLLPAAGVLTAGIWILFQPVETISSAAEYFIIVLSGVLAVCLSYQLILLRKNNSPAGRLLKSTLTASLSVPFSLIVVLILKGTETGERNILSGISVICFGSMAFLLAVHAILISFCGYQSTKDSLKTTSDFIKSKKLIFTRITILKDAFLVAVKSLLSILSWSFFMFVNALYSVGMGTARLIAVRMHTQSRAQQITSYRYVGIIVSAAGICYVLYSIRLFFGGSTGVYSMHIALVIALYTFVEFGINLRDLLRLRKSKALEAKALRAISFSSTLICFVLTQTAILSFASEGDNRFANALAGVVFGTLGALIGLYVILDSFLHQKLLTSE